MKKNRAWSLCVPCVALVGFWGFVFSLSAVGQPGRAANSAKANSARGDAKSSAKSGAKAAPALSFQVNAQFAYHDDEDATAPGDVINARVWAQGGRARLETSVGERPLVVIIAPPYLYKLLPRSKTGTRYKMADTAKNPGLSSLDPQPWLRDPQAIRAALKKQGAKRIGIAKLNGTAVETWSTSQFMGRRGQITAWLRQSDALPVRLEIKSKQLTATANWRDYQTIRALPATHFAPPAGFRIRAAEE